jgi:hypothetical protein
VEQNRKGAFILKIVKNDDFDETDMISILKNLNQYVGDTEIDVKYVQEIPLVRTGKRSPVVSTIGEDFQDLEASHQTRKL